MSSLTTSIPATEPGAGSSGSAPYPFDYEGWKRISDSGAFRILADSALSSSHRIRDTAARMRELGYAGEDPGLLFAVATHLASTITSILRFGSPELKSALVPDLLSGHFVGAHAITETGAGSDVSSMQATATVDEASGKVRVNGRKVFITNAPIASHVVVYARTYRGGNDEGISAYVIDTTCPGVAVTANHITASLPHSPIGELELSDVTIPQSWRLGAEGAGLQVLDFVMKREIIYAFSADLGRAQKRIEDSVAFANSRRQFNSLLAEFQSVSFAIADMYVRHFAGTAMINEILSKIENNQDITKEVAAAKILISDANLQTAIEATHLRGAKGVQADSTSVQDVLDALAGPIYSGTNRIQKTRIAAMLGLLTDG
ncbi:MULTISPECIES: acyl-CoA dehydrogenase family protein [unclassified Arthrobacter]|uniref:acyl-CoA dehydrogenase family protein n=1 Tax=unclassified Arthrobacter TaxID=235627 RepID=UPI0015E3EBC0|nr:MULTISPECIES: acyl-CoA dehydrogenase family protein [unclassified Arthrobacter]